MCQVKEHSLVSDRLSAVDSLVDIRVVILSSGEPGRLRSPTTSLIDQVVREKGWAASLPTHTSYNPICPPATLTAALKHKICFELTVRKLCLGVCELLHVCSHRLSASSGRHLQAQLAPPAAEDGGGVVVWWFDQPGGTWQVVLSFPRLERSIKSPLLCSSQSDGPCCTQSLTI